MGAVRYQAAGGVVVGKNELVLVLRRPGRDKVRLPKGHVETGETNLEAALRKVAEESGYGNLNVLANLGHQVVRFEYKGRRVVRDEYYFLLQLQDANQVERETDELQFEPDWVDWEQALAELTFEAEREWMRRAQAMLNALQDTQNGEDAPAGSCTSREQ